MLKINCLVIAISALIVAISADKSKELNEKTDIYGISADRVEEILRRYVEEVDWDEVKVGGFKVAKIFSYLDHSCSFEALADPLLMDYPHYGTWNSGVRAFLEKHIAERKKSCAENFFEILKEAVEGFSPEDGQIFKEFENHVGKDQYLEKLAEDSKKNWKEDKRFPSCVKLIEKLSIPMSFKGWEGKRPAEEDVEFFNEWYGILEACKIYTETQCMPYYQISEPSYPTPRYALQLDFGDELIDLQMKCEDIIVIGMSDKSKAEREASKKLPIVQEAKKTDETDDFAAEWYDRIFSYPQ